MSSIEDQNTSSFIHNNFKSVFYQLMHAVTGNIEFYAQKKLKLIFPKITKNTIIDLCRESESIFRSESSLIDIKSPCLIIGDLHGHVLDLYRIIKYCGIPSDEFLNPKFKDSPNFEITNIHALHQESKYVFLGDIIDRGEFSVETITIVLLLKVLFPSKVYLIRGNHEYDFLAKQCGFLEQVHNLFDEYNTIGSSSSRHGELWSKQTINPNSGLEVYSAFMRSFSYLPFAVRVDGKMLCVHGGIGPQVFSVKSISQIERPITEFGVNDVADSLLWSDPSDKPELGNQPNTFQSKTNPQIPLPTAISTPESFSKPLINPLFSVSLGTPKDPISNTNTNDTCKLFEPSNRGTGFIFGAPALQEFLDYSNIDILVRAHECVMAGCEEMFNGRLITVFSASNYCGFVRNYSSVLHVKSEEEQPSNSISERCEVFRFYPLDYLRKPVPLPAHLNNNNISNNNIEKFPSAANGNASARPIADNLNSYRRYSHCAGKTNQLKTPINGLLGSSKISSARSQVTEESSTTNVSSRDTHKMAGIKISQASSFSRSNVPQMNPNNALLNSQLPPVSMKRARSNNTDLPALVIPTNHLKSSSVLTSTPTQRKAIKSAHGIALTPKLKPRARSEYK